MKKVFRPLIFGVCLIILISMGFYLIFQTRNKKSIIDSSTISIQYTYPRAWDVFVDPQQESNFNKVRAVLFRVTRDAALPVVAFHFWDDEKNEGVQYWVDQRKIEAGLQHSAKNVQIGQNAFLMLSSSDEPGLSVTELYLQIGERILQVNIQPEYVKGESPFFSSEVQNLLESIVVHMK